MKNHLLKLSLLVVVLSLNFLPPTNSSFVDTESSTGNTFTAGCWGPPSLPTLTSPADNSTAYRDSEWAKNPRMDWSDSRAACPDSPVVTYYYESYFDQARTRLAYRSSALTNSFIPAPGTPNGTYYWRVRSCNTAGECSEWTNPWKFTVDNTQSEEVTESVTTDSLPLLMPILPPQPDFTPGLNRTANRISFVTSNFPVDSIDYEILYQDMAGVQSIAGVIPSKDVVDGVATRSFYLGTCTSGGTCTPDTITVGSTISVNLNGQIKTIIY